MELLYYLQQRSIRPESASLATSRERPKKTKDDLEATLEVSYETLPFICKIRPLALKSSKSGKDIIF